MRSGQPMHNSKLTYLLALMDEVDYLKTQTADAGKGHIYTTISTLKHRIKELRKELEQENEDFS